MSLLTRRKWKDDPFNPSLERKKGECLATFWQQATPGTTYWRCLVPARHLPGQSLPFRIDDLKEKRGVPYLPRQRGDVAVWQFLGDHIRSRIAFGMRNIHGIKLVLEVDDNYLRSAPYLRNRAIAPWKESIDEAGAGYSHEMHRMLLPHVDAVVCSTEYLADAYSDFNDNVYLCPNSIDPDDWQYEKPQDDDVFRIAYYGSPSHVVDAPYLTKALKWASKQPGVEVWTVGFQNPSWSFEHQSVPWMQDLSEARESLFKFDLGLAPLKANRWSNGKSDVKILEYGMAGALPLMSPVKPFEYWFDIFPDLVVDEGDWGEAIQWAVKNRQDVRARAMDVRDHVNECRTIEHSIFLWRDALGV